jgi:hypothetical protein
MTNVIKPSNETESASAFTAAVGSALRILAGKYHDEAEAYDRTVCTGGMGRDGIMPACHAEMMKISKNAGILYAKFGGQAATLGYTRQQWQKAVSDHTQNK